jgi:hypothetical protein
MTNRLSSYPYVIVRLGCDICQRRGKYRLARLSAKFGPECSLDDVLARLAADCPDFRPRHPFKAKCGARFTDLEPPTRPPDDPAQKLRIVKSA